MKTIIVPLKKWYLRNIILLILVNFLFMDIIYLLFVNRRFVFASIFILLIQGIIVTQLLILHKQQSIHTKKLLDSEQRYQSLFLYNNAGIYVVNLDGTINSASPNLISTLGYSMETLKNQPFVALFTPEGKSSIHETFLAIINGEIISSSRKINMRHSNGDYLTFDLSSVALMAEGEIQGVIGFAKDITEFENSQVKLSEMQTQMNNIFESIDIVLWSLDVESGKVVTLSPASEKLYGYTPELYFKNPEIWEKRIHEEDKEKVKKRLVGIAEGALSCRNLEYRVVNLNGETRWVESRMFPVMNDKGQLSTINGIVFDITEKKLIEKNREIDLDLARLVQKSVLSQPIYTPTFSIDARYIPSKQLGGDMYAWYRIDDHRYGILIMDVMGHGISSSLICMSIRSLLKGIMQACSNPEEVIKELNDHMNRLFSETVTSANFFFTAISVVVDLDNNYIDYVNAGHPCGLLIDELGEIKTLDSTSIPIGLMPDMKLKKQRIFLHGSARLVLYTDGLIEVPGSLLQEQTDKVGILMSESKWDSITVLMDKLLAFHVENEHDTTDDICLICMDINSGIGNVEYTNVGYLI